jgi:hypothetical protein
LFVKSRFLCDNVDSLVSNPILGDHVRFCTESRPKQYLPDFAVSSYIPTVNGLSFSTSARFRGLPVPLGSPRKWIIGNLLQMPKGDFVTQTTKWAKEYGKSNKNFE